MNITKITKDNVSLFADLSDDILSDHDLLLGVGCLDDDGSPIGSSLIDSDGDCLVVSSIYVDEKHRRRGAGSLMLDGILEMAEEAELDTVDAYFTEPETEHFFLKNHFLVLQGHPIYQISYKDFVSAPQIRRTTFSSSNCIRLQDLRPSVRGGLVSLLNHQGYVSRLSQYDQGMSFVYVTADDRPVAFALVSDHKDVPCITVEHIFNTERDNPANTMQLLAAVASEIIKKNPKLTIEFIASSEKIRHFVEIAIGDSKKLKEIGHLYHAVRSLK